MAKAKMGAVVSYCGHNGNFIADIWQVGNTNVVRASQEVTGANLIRDDRFGKATHHLSDFPKPGFWRPDLGVFVVPQKQVKELR